MVKIYLKANCGCGFSTDDIEKAKKHVEETKHKMDILGGITP
jgi:predicted adenine nucleotide alpha hydrolase (AANH) superfamily ATPase